MPSEAWIAGRYRVEAALGQAGTAQVLRVRERGSGRALALKQLREDAGPKLMALFELKYQTLASLRHPRTVEVFEYGHHAGSAYSLVTPNNHAAPRS